MRRMKIRCFIWLLKITKKKLKYNIDLLNVAFDLKTEATYIY